jgi:ubiquinone biosynthesis protein UbiJ
MLPQLIAQQTLMALIKTLQHLDDQFLAPLLAYQHKIICFDISPMPTLYYEITAQGLTPIDPPSQSDVTIRCSTPVLIQFILSKKSLPSDMSIQGDIECAKALLDCWQHLDIDLEGQFAKVMGDTQAHLLMKTLRSTQRWFTENLSARIEDVARYMQDERQWLVTEPELQQFCQDVDKLRHAVDRLEAKLTRYQS